MSETDRTNEAQVQKRISEILASLTENVYNTMIANYGENECSKAYNLKCLQIVLIGE